MYPSTTCELWLRRSGSYTIYVSMSNIIFVYIRTKTANHSASSNPRCFFIFSIYLPRLCLFFRFGAEHGTAITDQTPQNICATKTVLVQRAKFFHIFFFVLTAPGILGIYTPTNSYLYNIIYNCSRNGQPR